MLFAQELMKLFDVLSLRALRIAAGLPGATAVPFNFRTDLTCMLPDMNCRIPLFRHLLGGLKFLGIEHQLQSFPSPVIK
jgi:hypothetical protein